MRRALRDLACGLFVVWTTNHTLAHTTVAFMDFKATYTPSDAVLLDSDGVAIGSKRIDTQVRRLPWVSLQDISPALIPALLAAEDKRYFKHSGIDWQALTAALWQNWTTKNHKSQRGASTISMQVAASLNPDLARPKAGRSLAQKWDQVSAAQALESTWDKQQILEAYLNTVVFRGELQGLHAASRGLLNKAPSGLDRRESALLAALIRAPSAKPRLIARRACLVLQVTDPATICNPEDFENLLRFATLKPQVSSDIAPHAAQHLLSSATPIYQSSLQAPTQQAARAALNEQIALLTKKSAGNAQDGAVVVLDNRTGAVLAYVGSSGAFSAASAVDAARALRQVGSTLKPFLYALAFDKNLLSPASVLDDSPLTLSTSAGLYTPQNYDQQFIGPVTVRKALASSLNIPAVRTIQIAGIASFHQSLQKLGFSGLHADPEHYGYALGLGAADLRLLDLTNAYRTLANSGVYSEVVWQNIPTALKTTRVFSAASAWQIAHILSDNTARAHTFGFDSVLATPMWTAVKTGTSKDMRDNWCIGFSEHFTVGVWVGNADGQAMRNVSGVSGAAPVWADVMRHLYASPRVTTSRPKPAPASLFKQEVEFEESFEPARTEWFNAAFQSRNNTDTPLKMMLTHDSGKPQIIYPTANALIAWDPDIPTAMQGIIPKHSGRAALGYSDIRWVYNNQVLSVDASQRLTLKAGMNELRLESAEGQVLDRVQFEVRGMSR